MTVLRYNNVFGTVSVGSITLTNTGGIGDSAVSFASAPVFPSISSSDLVKIIVEPDTPNEEIIYMSPYVAGATTGTALRGQEGSIKRAHTGVAWVHGPTAFDVGGPSILDVAWRRLGVANINDDEFNTGALDPAWVQVVPSGTQSVLVAGDVCSIKVNSNAGSNCCGLVKPLNGFAIGDTIETAVRSFSIQNYIMAGLVLSDGVAAGSNIIWVMPYNYTSSALYGELSVRSGQFNNSSVTDYLDHPPSPANRGILYQRLKWVAANTFHAYWSIDGVQWTDFGDSDMAFTMTPTHMGLGTSTWGGTADSLASYEYFRVV